MKIHELMQRVQSYLKNAGISLIITLPFLNTGEIFAQGEPPYRIVNTKNINLTDLPWGGFALNGKISPDGRHVMYIRQNGKNQYVNADGVDHTAFGGYIRDMIFSPDSKRNAYLMIKPVRLAKEEIYLIVDGINIGQLEATNYFDIRSTVFGFTPDSKIYYQDKAGWHIGDKVYNYKSSPSFSPDGSRFAFINSSLEKNYVFIDGEERPVNGVVMGGQVFFSPDSKHYVFMVIRPEGVFLNMDGQETPAEANIRAAAYPQSSSKKNGVVLYEVGNMGSIVFSPDGKRLAYWGKTDKNRETWVVDGKTVSGFKDVTRFQFTQDSKHFIYLALEDGAYKVILDNVKIPQPKNTFNFSISPDGGRIAFATSYFAGLNLKYRINIDDSTTEDKYSDVTLPVFSSGGKHFLYSITDKNTVSIVADRVITAIDGSLLFTSDGRVFIFDSENEFHYVQVKETGKDKAEISIIDAAFVTGDK